jgi:hypothetical protein
MIKNIVDNYKKCAFVCQNMKEFDYFIKCACKEITFTKGKLFVEDETYILNTFKRYLRENEKLCALIVRHKNEYQFYARNYNEYYNDWVEYKFINFTHLSRKNKIQKLNDNL